MPVEYQYYELKFDDADYPTKSRERYQCTSCYIFLLEHLQIPKNIFIFRYDSTSCLSFIFIFWFYVHIDLQSVSMIFTYFVVAVCSDRTLNLSRVLHHRIFDKNWQRDELCDVQRGTPFSTAYFYQALNGWLRDIFCRKL